MAAGRIILPAYMPALDSDGDPIAGAKAYFYLNNTTTLQDVYANADLSVPLSNPVVSDASGVFVSVFADTADTYSVTVTDADGAPLASWDGVQASLNLAGAAESAAAAAASAAAAADDSASANADALSAQAARDAAQSAAATAGSSIRPRFHAYGGQLRKLHNALTNPLEQFTGVVFAGDSITWGKSLPENGTSSPATQTLSTQRDVFASPSFVNEFKRYIGAQYFNSTSPTLSNWSYSSGGQSTATYTRTLQLYPNQAPFTTSTSGSSVTITESANSSTLLGYQMVLADGNTAGTSYCQIAFTFTGTTFDLIYSSNTGDNADYELFVDGVSQGVFTTSGGVNFGNRRTHTFSYVRNKTVQIRSVRNSPTGTQRVRLEAIEVVKTCRITNQGISGTTAVNYVAYCFGAQGPSILSANDTFFFVQLGTNDRASTIAYSLPNGRLSFRKKLQELVSLLVAGTQAPDLILMCSNPATLDSPPTYTFNMRDVRDTIDQVAKSNSLDFVDNFAAFHGLTMTDVAPDGLHPNAAGHAIYLRNICGALEAA